MVTYFLFDHRFELALQQHELMDVFFDDWRALADEDSTFGSKSDNHLKVHDTFYVTDRPRQNQGKVANLSFLGLKNV